MGNGSNHQNLHFQQKTTFLPMLCSRPSIKDVGFPNWEDRPAASFSDDPLSPKIGCMGQVKRNNKIVGFPASSHKLTIPTKTDASVKYSKLRRIFSGRNFTTTTITTPSAATHAVFHRRREVGVLKSGSGNKIDESCTKNSSASVISIAEMDPPLPVVKKVQKPADAGEENSLWKRRSGGVPLKNLQLQQIQLNRHHQLAPTTV